MLDSSQYTSKVVNIPKMHLTQIQTLNCKEDINNSCLSHNSELFDHKIHNALIQICSERGYEYHEIAHKICTKSNFAVELSLYMLKRFNLKWSDDDFILSIKRSWIK